jgi:fucose permease
MSTEKKSLFVTDDGKNLAFTFILVSSLFLLWGFCNGMIDVMDKHFQDELGLTKSQSAWVQFAHYLGYFLMAMPAGWLASKLGYKGGIIAGLLMVAAGGFWFLPATHINSMAHTGYVSAGAAFVAYLSGVCAIAAGLTFLETIANPYTTVLGPSRYAATRINLAQSCNGIGWIVGPIVGSMFFYSKDASGRNTGSETLYIPYIIIAVVVLLLSVVFYFANVPDIKAAEDIPSDDNDKAAGKSAKRERRLNRGLAYVLLLLNSAVLVFLCGMIVWLILSAAGLGEYCVGVASRIPRPASMKLTPDSSLLLVIAAIGCVLLVMAALWLVAIVKKMTIHSIWSHPHFSSATLTQFFYVAAQAGIFSFLINYMTEEPPPVPAVLHADPSSNSWWSKLSKDWIEVKTKFCKDDIKDLPAMVSRLKQKPDAVSAFLSGELSDETRVALADYEQLASESNFNILRSALVQDLNKIVKQDATKVKKEQILYDSQRFNGIKLGGKTQELLSGDAKDKNSARLNRMLLADAYPGVLAYDDAFLGISDAGAAILASFGFVCFLFGRFSGAALLKKFSAHKVLGLYGLLNVVACFLVFCKLGWISAACVFVSYFLMSIMFPTIFALSISGLGANAKKASAFIVMAIMGGAVLPKLMGHVADLYDMSHGFIVPMACFAIVALYGFCWPKLSGSASMHGVSGSGGH